MEVSRRAAAPAHAAAVEHQPAAPGRLGDSFQRGNLFLLGDNDNEEHAGGPDAGGGS